MVWSTRLVCRLVIREPRKTCTPMPTAMPAAMRMDWTGLLRRKRVAMRKLSMVRPPAPSATRRVVRLPGAPAGASLQQLVQVHDLFRQPSGGRADEGRASHPDVSAGQLLLQRIHRVPHGEPVEVRGGAHHHGVRAEPPGGVGDLRHGRVRTEEVRGPAGHVEAVGHHAQAEVVPLFGRARQQDGAPRRLDLSLRLQDPGIHDLHDGPHRGAREVLLPDGRLALLPGGAGVGQDPGEDVAVQGRDRHDAGRDRLHGGPHSRRLVVLGQGRRHGLVDRTDCRVQRGMLEVVAWGTHRPPSSRVAAGRNGPRLAHAGVTPEGAGAMGQGSPETVRRS